MAIFTASNVVKTLTIHKPECRVIPWQGLNSCGCGVRGQDGSQRWYCESHILTDSVNAFMKDKFWAVLFCDICFRDR